MRTFVFSDNVAIVGQDQEECSQAAQNLVHYFNGHHAGPFHVKCEILDARYGFEHLGYWLIKSSNGVSVEPSANNIDRLFCRLSDHRSKFAGMTVEAIAEKLLKGAPACTRDFQARLEEELRFAGLGLEELFL